MKFSCPVGAEKSCKRYKMPNITQQHDGFQRVADDALDPPTRMKENSWYGLPM
jgi:hypothetical protein